MRIKELSSSSSMCSRQETPILSIFSSVTAESCVSPFCFPPDEPIIAKIIDVVDGDTLIAAVLSPITNKVTRLTIRVARVNTPEMHPRKATSEEAKILEVVAAQKAALVTTIFLLAPKTEIAFSAWDRTYAKRLLGESNSVVTLIPRKTNSAGSSFDSFGRVIADVIRYDGKSLSDHLIAAGVGVKFME